MDITRLKKFPENYSDDIVSVLDDMSFTGTSNIMIAGSMGLRSMLYAADVDGYEIVSVRQENPLDSLAKRFQSIVRKLKNRKNIYITAIKCGEVPAFRVIPEDAQVSEAGKVVGYDYASCIAKVEALLEAGIINRDEAKMARGLLKKKPTAEQFLMARGEIKFHIVRWTTGEVLKGTQILRDGRPYRLQEGFSSPSRTKLDLIAYADDRYIEFSLMYEFRNKGRVLNPFTEDARKSISEDIVVNMALGKEVKALKRIFSLARLDEDTALMEAILPILNGDKGRIYALKADIQTLIDVLAKNVSVSMVKNEVDQFKNRMSNIWCSDSFLRKEPKLLATIDSILATSSKAKMRKQLEKLLSEF
jgi:hypothetical protein